MCILDKERFELENKVSKDWKIIYKCRNCGKLFEKEALLVNFSVPTNSTLIAHKCKTGVYGYGDIWASITSKDEDWEDKTGTKDYIPQDDD